ncbi:MAG: hypothetical protein DIU78_003915 [Pseudomonadota bacterium]
MTKTAGDTLEDARATLLDVLADGLEIIDRFRERSRRTAAPPEPYPELDSGDFLADFLQLHLQYLNRLAGLGSSYSIVASRVLERVYDRFVGRTVVEPTTRVTVSGVAGERRRVRVSAHNLAPCPVRFRVAAQGEHAALVTPARSAPLGLGAGQRAELDVFVCFDERLAEHVSSRVLLESDVADVALSPCDLVLVRVPT